MGDATSRERYGSVAIEPTDDVVAGSFATWELTYEVGAIGMDDGSRLKVAANVSSDWGRPQFDDPAADNYATVETSGDAAVTASYDDHGHVRPMRDTIDVDVSDGALGAGETITLTLGDRSEGSMGHRVQTFPERGFELVALVDAFETGEFVRVPGGLTFDVVPGPAESLCAVAPSEAAVGEPVDVSVRGADYWGNAATGYDGNLRFEADGGVLARADAADGVARASVAFDEPGVHRVDVIDTDGDLRTTANPVRCTADAPDERTYWGDIHGQSGETVGTGTVEEYFAFARETAFLDFASHAGNDFQITDELWTTIRETVAAFNEPGDFVTFPCYEWSANTPNGGDHNVYFRDDDAAELHRSSNWQAGGEPGEGTYPVEALYEQFRGRDDVLIVPHQGGRPATLDALDPDLTPFVEILSVWGVFEWFGREALERAPVGFVAGSDDHTGRPGASHPTNAADWSFPIDGGLMAARADGLDRDSLWDAFVGRRVYGTTGARIHLALDVAGAGMGEAVTVDGAPAIGVDVNATAPIQRIDLFRGSDPAPVATRSFDDGDDRIAFTWTGARSKDRHKVQDWSGGLSIDRGRIADVEAVGFDHPGQGVSETTNTTVRWEGSTAGNYQGVRVAFDAPDEARVSFATPAVRETFDLGDLDERRVIDAGPVDRRLELRPVGGSSTLDADATFRDDPGPGTHPYYARVRQVDGEMAWSSPVRVTVDYSGENGCRRGSRR